MEDALPVSLMLLCAAATPSSRMGGFPAPDEGLDDAGRRAAGRVILETRFAAHALASPTSSAQETVEALGIAASTEPALADIDHGDWSGGGFADLPPDAMAAWLADPTQGAPGGESMEAVRERLANWLDGLSRQEGAVLAVTHATVIRTALAHAIGLPLRATLAIDIAPLAAMRLSFNRQWRLQSLGPA